MVNGNTTAIRERSNDLGDPYAVAVDLLVDRMRERPESPGQKRLLAPELVIRESSTRHVSRAP